MSTNKQDTYISQMTSSVMSTGTNGSIPAHLSGPLQWLSGWQVRRPKEKSVPIVAVDLALEMERSVRDGYYPGSAQQAARERAIDVQWVILKLAMCR